MYRVTPSNAHQLNLVKGLESMKGFDFWSKARQVKSNIDIMVSPKVEGQFTYILKHNSIDYSLLIQNVES